MSRDFFEVDRETPWLLPPSLQDWLPEGHLARFVVDIVEQLDLSDLTSDYSRGGKRAYHPALLLSLLFYGYATGVFSSRKLERATYEVGCIPASSRRTCIRITTRSQPFASGLLGAWVACSPRS